MLMLVLSGCGTSQQTTLSSEQLPEDIQKMKSLEETKIDEPMAIAGAPGSSSAEESQDLVKESQPPLETTQDSEEVGSSLKKELQDEIEGIPEVSKASPAGVSESPATSESTQVAKVAPVPLVAQPTDLSKLPLTLADVYFDYDQYDIRKDAIYDLETNAKVLIARYSGKKVVIQGHCDERGTEEYNLVLGKRRAQAVKNYLVDLGVPEKNLQVISYGKEKPFCLDHTRKCWQQNRRSHFVFQ